MHTTRQMNIGGVKIGGGERIAIQSMLSAPSGDAPLNIAQAQELEVAGCDIVRVAIPDKSAVALVGAIKEAVRMPLVADIHFDYRLAVEAAAAGVDKIRINPGNIGDADRIKQVVAACKSHGIPIRIGVNSGSLEKHILAKHGHPTPQGMVDSALYHAALLEQFDFYDIAISIKSSDVDMMVQAYRLLAESCTYPLHLGVTHAGTSRMGLIKSAIGIGSLLLDGIGDTIRVSLTAAPVEEIRAAKDILRAIGKGRSGVTLISCPTCGRAKTDLVPLANEVEQALADCDLPITVAVMGCAVNGPGEAREADLGVCCGEDCGVLFAKGEIVGGKIARADIVPALLAQVEELRRNAHA